MDREQAFDERIVPVLIELREICELHGISGIVRLHIGTESAPTLFANLLIGNPDDVAYAHFADFMAAIMAAGESTNATRH